MAYCKDPKNHRSKWWCVRGFEWFNYRRNRIEPTKTALIRCDICFCGWGTTNRELVAKLPTHRHCDHDWHYHNNTKRECYKCHAVETREI